MFLATTKFQFIRFFFSIFLVGQNLKFLAQIARYKKNLKLIFPSRSPVNVFSYHLSLPSFPPHLLIPYIKRCSRFASQIEFQAIGRFSISSNNGVCYTSLPTFLLPAPPLHGRPSSHFRRCLPSSPRHPFSSSVSFNFRGRGKPCRCKLTEIGNKSRRYRCKTRDTDRPPPRNHLSSLVRETWRACFRRVEG